MDVWNLPLRLILSFILGAVIGLEREINEKKLLQSGGKPQAVLGLRNFSIITSLGTIVALLHRTHPDIALLIGGSVLLLFIVFYGVDTIITKDTGITTELAMIYSFLIGLLLGFETFPIQLTLAITIVLILILSRKRKIKDVVEDIKQAELNAFIAYAIIAIVILPFLPNKAYSMSDIGVLKQLFQNLGPIEKIADMELFNPFRLWVIVALITGIDMIGYILERTIGKNKGWLLTSIAGGFVSSTATTQSLAQQSKSASNIHHLLAAALVANIVSFFQIFLLLTPVNTAFVIRLFPVFIAIISVGLLITVYFLKAKDKRNTSSDSHTYEVMKEHDIFELGPALRFAGIYLFISILSKVALEFYGGSALFLITTALGALAGLDAVMINTAQLAGERLDISLAVWAFIIANAINLLGKTFYSFLQGKKDFAVKFGISVLGIIGASFVSLLFM